MKLTEKWSNVFQGGLALVLILGFAGQAFGQKKPQKKPEFAYVVNVFSNNASAYTIDRIALPCDYSKMNRLERKSSQSSIVRVSRKRTSVVAPRQPDGHESLRGLRQISSFVFDPR